MQPTLVTWALVVFGAVTLAPLVVAQLAMLVKPHSQQARDMLIAKGEDWRDETHFRSALGCAWADWLLMVPLVASGSIGVLLGHAWGYVLWGAAGSMVLYINIVLWFMEKKYVYPSRGAIRYFTYYWGFFVYWGALALAYSVLRLSGIEF
jgi:hypothetical protein